MNFLLHLIYSSETLTLRKIFNYLKLKGSYVWSVVSGKPFVSGNPFSLSLETSSFCNLNCKHCPVGQGKLTREQGNMSLQTGKIILNQTYQNLLNLFLYFQGEPFLNKNLYSICKYAVNKGVYTVVSTNGHFLSEENIENLMQAPPHKIIVSLDGFTNETYNKYRKNGNFWEIVNGIEKLVRYKKLNKKVYPFVELQFLVFSYNEKQINDIKEYGKFLGADRVKIKTAQIYEPDKNFEDIPTNSKLSRYYINKNQKVEQIKKTDNYCKRLWEASVITWNGDVVPCCFDKNAENIMGNISETSFNEIWKSNKYNKFRNKVFENKNKVYICNNCTE